MPAEKKTTKKTTKTASRTNSKQNSQTNAKRKYDIVVFGATGFTGQLTAGYLADNAPKNANIALAARDVNKLQAIVAELSDKHPELKSYDMLKADVNDAGSLQALAESTRVVITTVGPYIQYGEPLVKACAESGTDYVDLTGEPEFVDRMRVNYHTLAEKNGARIVNSCGFDSIPHDLGVYYTVAELDKKHGDLAKRQVEINGYVSAGGKFSGGTWHSAVTAFSRFKEHESFKKDNRQALKMDVGSRTVKGGSSKIHKVAIHKDLGGKVVSLWGAPFPTIDPQVIRRSAKLFAHYGQDFRYSHNVLTKSLPKLVGGAGFVAGVFALAQLKPTRKLLLNQVKQGDGPSEKTRAKGWFKVQFKTKVNGKPSIETIVKGGDPGYGETSKMLAESALCLAFDRDKLPPHLGVTTPAGAMGQALIDRLQNAGIQFATVAQ